MQRTHVFAVLLLVAAVAAGVWFLFGRDTAVELPDAPGAQNAVTTPTGPGAATGDVVAGTEPAIVREAVARGAGPVLSDPDIRAGLCGFRGRVVDHTKVPVADCGVRLYRGGMDSVLGGKVDLFAEIPDFEPEFIAAEVRTAENGTFEITGVWPHAMFLIYVGLDTDAPTFQFVSQVPSPGEIVDLGDIVLNDAGVITGTVVDDDGEAVAGALVRAADLPGTLAAFFPIERFDPEGALLIRERSAPVSVLKMPPWVKRVFDHLPIPTTRTGPDGSFRLVGVVPGSNMLATTAPGHLSDVKPAIQVRAGAEKDVGTIRLRFGEELFARVLDDRGEPVAGAEVLAGSTLSMVPVDLARELGETNQKGEIAGFGFAPGNVTVAARRSAGHAWVVAEPQRILGEVIVTLPAHFGATVRVQNADGSPVESPDLRLLRGRAGQGAAELVMLGFLKPVPLDDRLSKTEDGALRIDGLNRGEYTLLAELPGLATGAASFVIREQDATATIVLEQPDRFAVRVVDQEDRPVRNVMITAEPRGESLLDMPVECGRTDAEGALVIDRLQAERLRISAEHPKWGVVHGETDGEQELVLRMLEPGAIEGRLTENGEVPTPGKYSVTILHRGGDGPRGPVEFVPQIVAAGLDGTFRASALQPGRYRIASLKSLDVLRSPGSVLALGQSMFLDPSFESTDVEVVSGQVAQVDLEVGEKPIEGPTARVFGSVTIDGRAGKDHIVTAYGGRRRFAAQVDESGRFDLGTVPAGDLYVSVFAPNDGIMMGNGKVVWSENLQLDEAEDREMLVDVVTSTIAGNCHLPDGTPAANLRVRANGSFGEDGRRSARLSERTDDAGAFRFEGIAEGRWTLSFDGRVDERRYEADDVVFDLTAAQPQIGLRIDLRASLQVTGRVDASALPEAARRGFLMLTRITEGEQQERRGGTSWHRVDEDGEFRADGLDPGRYSASLRVDDGPEGGYACGELQVPPTGLTGVVLVPRR